MIPGFKNKAPYTKINAKTGFYTETNSRIGFGVYRSKLPYPIKSHRNKFTLYKIHFYNNGNTYTNIFNKGCYMLGTILLVVLILLLIGALPRWPHSSQWGYGPTSVLSTILIIVLILFLLGKL